MNLLQTAFFRQAIVNYLSSIAEQQQTGCEAVKLVFLTQPERVAVHLYSGNHHLEQVRIADLVIALGLPAIEPFQESRINKVLFDSMLSSADAHAVDHLNIRLVLKIDRAKLGAFLFNGSQFLIATQIETLATEILAALEAPLSTTQSHAEVAEPVGDPQEEAPPVSEPEPNQQNETDRSPPNQQE